eukprot:Rhum_TRINITY_DN25146_c0_g1::Rhum_TRINITY_DN25146_c0_g1_i1::g.181382::m.181382
MPLGISSYGSNVLARGLRRVACLRTRRFCLGFRRLLALLRDVLVKILPLPVGLLRRRVAAGGVDNPPRRQQARHADGAAARVDTLRRHTRLGADAETVAVAETRRRILHDARGVDVAEEVLGRLVALRDDSVGQEAPVRVDVGDGALHRRHELDRDDLLLAPLGRQAGCLREPEVLRGARATESADLRVAQGADDLEHAAVLRQVFVHQQRVEGVELGAGGGGAAVAAHVDVLALAVEDDLDRLLHLALLVDVHVADALRHTEDGDVGGFPQRLRQLRVAPRENKIDEILVRNQAGQINLLSDVLDRIGGPVLPKGLTDKFDDVVVRGSALSADIVVQKGVASADGECNRLQQVLDKIAHDEHNTERRCPLLQLKPAGDQPVHHHLAQGVLDLRQHLEAVGDGLNGLRAERRGGLLVATKVVDAAVAGVRLQDGRLVLQQGIRQVAQVLRAHVARDLPELLRHRAGHEAHLAGSERLHLPLFREHRAQHLTLKDTLDHVVLEAVRNDDVDAPLRRQGRGTDLRLHAAPPPAALLAVRDRVDGRGVVVKLVRTPHAGRAGVQAVHVGEQQQELRVEVGGKLGGQGVVVDEPRRHVVQLLVRHVVLVQDGHDAARQQLVDGARERLNVRGGAEVRVRQQHVADNQVELRKHLVVQRHERRLARRRSCTLPALHVVVRLQQRLAQSPLELETPPADRDGAAADQDDLLALLRDESGNLLHDVADSADGEPSPLVGEDVAAHLDHHPLRIRETGPDVHCVSVYSSPMKYRYCSFY